ACADVHLRVPQAQGRDLLAESNYETLKASGALALPERRGATVTTSWITPMPESRAACRIPTASAAFGRVHVEPAAQRAVMAVIATGVEASSVSVQPAPVPRPSAIVSGTCTDRPATALMAGTCSV